MYEKKYSMTREENVFWAKRNQVDYIWKSANLEGIAVTFPETQTICEGISVQGKSIDDINSIVQLKRGLADAFSKHWMMKRIWPILKGLHLEIGRMTVLNAGALRMDEVRIAGSSYIPPMPDEKQIGQTIRSIMDSECGYTEKALEMAVFPDEKPAIL